MANIFGSRYTSPGGAGAVWEATADLAQTAFDVGLGIIEQVDSAEAESQVRSAEVGLLEDYDDFAAWTDENGHNPDAWLPEYDTRAKQWKTDRMAGVTQKRAQQTASGNIDMNIARWRAAVRQKQYTQKAHNIGVDAEIDVKNLTAFPNRILDDGDVTERIKALGLRVAQMWEGKYFDTEKERDDYRLANQKKIVSHYALQQADAPEDFDALNRIFKETGWMGAEGFDPDDIAKLKERFKQQQDIAEGERNDRADAFDRDMTKKILRGGSGLAEYGKEIEENPYISGSQKRVLMSFLQSRIDGLGKKSAKENDPDALAEAYKMMTSNINQDQKFQKLMALKTKLKSTTVDGFIQDIYKPETVSNEIYKQYSSAINSLKTGKMFSTQIAENISLSVKAQNLLRTFAQQNPDATEEDYAQFFNKLIENQAKWWAVLPGGRPWSARREKSEQRLSIPWNIEAIQKEMKTLPKTATSQYKAGDARTVNGVTYTYDGQYWTD